MSMYSQFKTDDQLETAGIVIDYGDFRITIARAGGANKRYLKVLEAKTKPFQRMLLAGSMDPALSEKILRECYAEAVVLNWEIKVKDGEEETWLQGIEGPDGGTLPFSKDNVLLTLANLPDLFIDLRQQADKSALFLKTIQEDAAGN